MLELKYKELAISLYESLKNDSFFYYLKNAILGDEKTKEQVMLRYMNYSIHDAYTYGKVGTHKNENSGASLWILPLSSHLNKIRKTDKKEHMASIFGRDVYAKICLVGDFMNSQNDKYVSDEMWYL